MGDAHGRADIVVNSAGFTRPVPHGDLDSLTDEETKLIKRLSEVQRSPEARPKGFWTKMKEALGA